MAKRDMVVGVRLTVEDVAKLDRLAAKTYRGRADILRCLISQAAAAEHPDLIIGGALPSVTLAEAGKAHVG
jgi:hypothetical protein